VTLSISKEEKNGEYKAYLKEETTSCLLDKKAANHYIRSAKKISEAGKTFINIYVFQALRYGIKI